MKAIILAAGRGSRMQSLTDDKPKCLVNVHGKALLDWQLSALHESGIDEIAIVTGYKRELLTNRGLVEFHNPRWAETNMVSSLSMAEDWLTTEPCIVSYSDIFYQSTAILSLMNTPASLAITFDPDWIKLWKSRFDDVLSDAETFRLNSDNTLSEIGNKPENIEQIQGQYMGLIKFTPEGWTEVQRMRNSLKPIDCDKIHMTGLLQKVIENDHISITAVPYRNTWGEVDTEQDILCYEQTI